MVFMFHGAQAKNREVQALAGHLEQLAINDTQVGQVGSQGRVVKKGFDKLSTDLIRFMGLFVCGNVEEYRAFSKVCTRFRDQREFAFRQNPQLIADFCSKRAITTVHSNILDGIPEPTLRFIKAQASTVESFTYPPDFYRLITKATKSNVEALVAAFPNIKKLDLSRHMFEETDCLAPLFTRPLCELTIREGRDAAFPQLIKVISQISTLQKFSLPNLALIHVPAASSLENFQYLQKLTNLRELSFKNCYLGDKELAYVPKANLTALVLNCYNITDAGLVHISEATKLQKLNLENTQITNNGLTVIGNLHFTHLNLAHCDAVSDLSGLLHMESLEELNLASTSITDEGLKPLAGAINLTALSLWDCKQIDGSGLQHMTSPHHKLRKLNLRCTTVNQLAHIPTLTHFCLSKISGTRKIDDEFVAGMSKQLGNLELLQLDGWDVSDSGLQSLASLKKLSFLELCFEALGESRKKQNTEAGIEQLKSQLPRLNVNCTNDGSTSLIKIY
jgi:hypothetical protein